MAEVMVQFLGGPLDGRVRVCQVREGSDLPAPALETFEPTGRVNFVGVPFARTVTYRLLRSGGGLVYVHPSIRLPD